MPAPNQTVYGIANVLGVSFKSCPCWKDSFPVPVNSWKKKCTDPTHVDTCEATVRCIGGVNIKYTFACDANEAGAGYIFWDASTGILTVWNWLTES